MAWAPRAHHPFNPCRDSARTLLEFSFTDQSTKAQGKQMDCPVEGGVGWEPLPLCWTLGCALPQMWWGQVVWVFTGALTVTKSRRKSSRWVVKQGLRPHLSELWLMRILNVKLLPCLSLLYHVSTALAFLYSPGSFSGKTSLFSLYPLSHPVWLLGPSSSMALLHSTSVLMAVASTRSWTPWEHRSILFNIVGHCLALREWMNERMNEIGE